MPSRSRASRTAGVAVYGMSIPVKPFWIEPQLEQGLRLPRSGCRVVLYHSASHGERTAVLEALQPLVDQCMLSGIRWSRSGSRDRLRVLEGAAWDLSYDLPRDPTSPGNGVGADPMGRVVPHATVTQFESAITEVGPAPCSSGRAGTSSVSERWQPNGLKWSARQTVGRSRRRNTRSPRTRACGGLASGVVASDVRTGTAGPIGNVQEQRDVEVPQAGRHGEPAAETAENPPRRVEPFVDPLQPRHHSARVSVRVRTRHL